MLTLWKSLVFPRLDYCSQLFNPSSRKQQLEMIQRSFLRKINGECNLNYWEQLQTFKISSLERWRERYQIVYVWKILEGLVPNFPDSSKITPRYNDRCGRSCYQRSINRNSVQQLRCNSLSIHGVQVFNALPRKVRDLRDCTKEKFKSNLDFLKRIPDELQIPGYTAIRRSSSNSILDMKHLC